MSIITAYDVPIQDERLSPYNLPNEINPLRGAFTMFGLETLNNIKTVQSLAQSSTSFLREAMDGHFSESPEVSSPLTAEQLARVKQEYPELEFGAEASREQISAAIDRREREKAMEYLTMHASPGFSGEAALFAGDMAAQVLNFPALKGAQWISKGIGKGSELLASKVAESAVSRLGGEASVLAEQMIADNAGKLAFLKGAGGLGAFTAIQELETQGSARLSGVLTPNEADYRLMDGVFNVASSGLVGGLLGITAEKLTGHMINKSFYETDIQKQFSKDFEKATTAIQREKLLSNINLLGIEPGSNSENLSKAAEVVKAFFQSSKESTERATLDNVSQSLEAGKEPDSTYLHEINRHDAWQRLQGYIEQSSLSQDEFIDALESNRSGLSEKLNVENPTLDDLQAMSMNEALIDLATKTEAEVMPTDESKAAYIRSMKENHVNFEDQSAPFINLDDVPKQSRGDVLNERIKAFSDDEMLEMAKEKANRYASSAIKRKTLLDYEQPLKDFIAQFGNQIAKEIDSGAIFDADYLKRFFEYLSPDGLDAIETLLDASKSDVDFMLESIRDLFDRLQEKGRDNATDFTPEELEQAIAQQFDYVKAQVIRSQRDAASYQAKLKIMDSAIKALDKAEGQGIKQALNALLDRSLFQFEGANSGTFRKMNVAEQHFKAQLTTELDRAKVMEFWNDTNSSSEITRAIFNLDMDLPADDISPVARRVAEIINRFYDKALDLYAKEGILIPKLKGRIHHQWHNPIRILKIPLRQRLKMTLQQRRDFSFDNWYKEIENRVDMERTFKTDEVIEDEPGFDINNPVLLRDAFRRMFDKIVDRDFRQEHTKLSKSNLLNKRTKQRVIQFKTPEDFAAYNRKFGSGDAQSAIIRELNGMFREVELIKDWGAEPEKMLADIMEHAKDLPGWKEYALRRDKDTPQRLMHLMRFGAAHSGTMFSEVIYNLKAYESVTKLGNLVFLNASDSLAAANALNRFAIPMMESITSSFKEVFSRYTPEQKQDYLRMFSISKEQYYGGFYRHFEDGTLSDRLSKMIRITMKLTGTENSEYSNRSMVGQSISNWFATNLMRHEYDAVDAQTRATMGRYEIGRDEWNVLKDAVQDYEGKQYIGWDTVAELSDSAITDYLKSKGVTEITQDRIDMARDELAQRYRLLMQDQMDDALNKRSLVETDLLRFKRKADEPSVINDLINGAMLFKTFGFMWIRRHVGDRIYGRGAQGYRTSQIQGTADWHGLMKLMSMSFAMEFGINQMKSLANDQEPLPLNGKTAFDSLLGSLGPIAYLTRLDGSNFTSSISQLIGGPIMGDIDRVLRIASQFEKGYWKGDYTTAEVNSIKFLASQFGGVPMLKPALNTLLFDNIIQNLKGRRLGHIIDNVASNQQGQ